MNVPPHPSAAPADPQDGSSSTRPAAEGVAEQSERVAEQVPAAAEQAAAERSAERRRRLAEQIVAGMLPETTSDERPSGSTGSGFSEQWYRENRPPHHG